VVVGVFGYLRLGVDLYPNVDFPIVTVITTLPGAAPEEVESEVTDKIEEAVNTISGIDELRSISSDSRSVVTIQFVLEKDVDVAAEEVRDHVNRVLRDLPKEIDPPTVAKIDPQAMPVLALAVSANRSSLEITEFADKVLRRRLESVSGVGQVSIIGGQKRQINVYVDPFKLRAHGISVTDVERALATENLQTPGGSLKMGQDEFTLRTMGRVPRVEDLNKIPVVRRSDHTVNIDDVAIVEDSAEERTSLAYLDDNPTVLLQLLKQSGTNTVEVVDNILNRLDQIRKELPPDYRVEVVQDTSLFIRASTKAVQEHLVFGALFAAIVVYLFLANSRTTFISALAIPTSIVATFGLLWLKGYTLNMITLLALTLCVGIVVDDAIVVIENIFRRMEEFGEDSFEAARNGTKEIGLAVLAITLSLVATFAPIAFMTGIVGRFMSSFGVTMSFAILVSLLVSFSLTPSLGARLLRTPKVEQKLGAYIAEDGPPPVETQPVSKKRGVYYLIESGYIWLLELGLRYRWLVVVLTIATLVSIVPMGRAVNKNFLPNNDQSEFQITLRAPEGTSLEATDLIARRIARDIRQLQGVRYTVTTVGAGTDQASNSAQIYVRLADIYERKFDQFQMMSYVREQILPRYAKEKLRVSIAQVSGIQTGDRNADIQFVLGGPDMKKLSEYADVLMATLKAQPGAVDVDSSLILGKPEIDIFIDRAKASELGVSTADIAHVLRLLVAGDKVSSYNEGGEQYDIRVRALPELRNNLQNLALITVPSARFGAIPITDVVVFKRESGPADIRRVNRQRSVTLYADVAPGYSQQAMLDALNAKVRELNMPAAYKASLVGRSKELARSFQAFFQTFLMAVCFIYLVLAALFESWLQPLIILLCLPLSVPFGIFSLWVARDSLNVFSLLGVLVLFAIVKKNAILQVDHTNDLRAQGMERHAAIIQANRDRLRPILMTTIAFVAGMLPLFLSKGYGAGTNRTISTVVIGGQTLSLLLTLIVTPVFYALFDDWRNSKWLRLLFSPLRLLLRLSDRADAQRKNGRS
jgi:HAE1 family hydrophobic/amphiphilic exporter-1